VVGEMPGEAGGDGLPGRFTRRRDASGTHRHCLGTQEYCYAARRWIGRAYRWPRRSRDGCARC
jgi:hypothetical protein